MTPSRSLTEAKDTDLEDLDRIELKRGSIFLILEERPIFAYQLFKHFIATMKGSATTAIDPKDGKEPIRASSEGIMITRHYPPDLIKAQGLVDTSIYWLTTNIASKENTISPTSITKLNFLLNEFFTQPGDGIILIDCIEYITTQNSFETVLRLIQAWNDKIVGTKKRLLLSIDPLTLSIRQLHLIKRETLDVQSSK